MVEYPSIKDIQHPLECGTPSEMLHYGLEYHCAEYDVLVQKCTKNIISHYTIGHPWLEDGQLGPCSHPACPLMCSVEGIQACTSQAGGDDDPIPVREYTVYVRQ